MQNNDDINFDSKGDPLYQSVREQITQGKRLPYREYLNRRTIHYIENVATDHEIEDLKTAISNRLRL